MPDAFASLRGLLARHTDALVVKTDTADEYYLDTPYLRKDKTPLFFAAVKRKPTGATLYLSALYTDPDLWDSLPNMLQKRRTGKSCLAFRTVDDAQADALAAFLDAAMDRYRAHGYVPAP